MNYKNILDIIDRIENKEDEDLTFLYNNDLIDLQKLYNKCALWLFYAEKHNYPKNELSNDEKRIYGHNLSFFESRIGEKYSATYNGYKLV